MTQAIFIGKWIYQQLRNNDTIRTLCPNKVFPLIAEQTTTFPFIVYWRNTITGEHSKDGYHQDHVSFTVSCVSDNYTQSLDIAQAARESLEGLSFEYIGGQSVKEKMQISFCNLTNIEETYQENAFVQMLTFGCKIN